MESTWSKAVLLRRSRSSCFAGAAQHASPPPEPPRVLQDLLARADVQLNGSRPWDIQVHDKHMYERVFASWSLGLGESYMDGEWDCDALDELFTRSCAPTWDRPPWVSRASS